MHGLTRKPDEDLLLSLLTFPQHLSADQISLPHRRTATYEPAAHFVRLAVGEQFQSNSTNISEIETHFFFEKEAFSMKMLPFMNLELDLTRNPDEDLLLLTFPQHVSNNIHFLLTFR